MGSNPTLSATGLSGRTLSDEALYPCLCVHGCNHGWARLKWLGEYDRVHMPLPRGLGFLYHLLRLPLWAGRLLARIGRRAAPGPAAGQGRSRA